MGYRAEAGACWPPTGPGARPRNGRPAARGRINQVPGRLRYQAGQGVHRGRDVVEGSRPAASRLPGPAELGCGDGVPVRGECFGQRAGVEPVVGGPPEAAMQEDHQWGMAAGRLQTILRPRGQPQVGHVVRILAVPNDQVRRPGGPAQNVSWFRIGLPWPAAQHTARTFPLGPGLQHTRRCRMASAGNGSSWT